MDSFWGTVAGIIGSFGGATVLVFLFSNWLGKLWASRIMEKERAAHSADLEKLRAELKTDHDKNMEFLKSEIAIFQEKCLKSHHDKVAIYRAMVNAVSGLVANLDRFRLGHANPAEAPLILHEFNLARLRMYGYAAMIAPQAVMDAQDRLIDYLFSAIGGSVSYDWKELRSRALELLNEVRKDVGINTEPIKYRGPH